MLDVTWSELIYVFVMTVGTLAAVIAEAKGSLTKLEAILAVAASLLIPYLGGLAAMALVVQRAGRAIRGKVPAERT